MRNFNLIMAVIFGSLIHTSCVKTDDFELPKTESKEINLDGDITGISAVKSNFDPETEEIYVFSETNTWMEAYVVSSDEGGNFYK